MMQMYRVTKKDSGLGLVDLDLKEIPRLLVGHYHSYLLPRHGDGKSQIYVNPTPVRYLLSHPVSVNIIHRSSLAITIPVPQILFNPSVFFGALFYLAAAVATFSFRLGIHVK